MLDDDVMYEARVVLASVSVEMAVVCEVRLVSLAKPIDAEDVGPALADGIYRRTGYLVRLLVVRDELVHEVHLGTVTGEDAEERVRHVTRETGVVDAALDDVATILARDLACVINHAVLVRVVRVRAAMLERATRVCVDGHAGQRGLDGLLRPGDDGVADDDRVREVGRGERLLRRGLTTTAE